MSNILKVNNVNDYARWVGTESTHPLICVINYSEVSPIRHSLNNYGVYGMFFQDKNNNELVYGCGRYDYKDGSLICFMSLVNDNGRWHHLSEYYAQKLCISLNYLNDIVKEKSGRTVFMWICDYLITEAKAQLLHSSNNVQQVSDYLDFPNSAFFCRFFKKHTGFTPLQFRKLRLI